MPRRPRGEKHSAHVIGAPVMGALIAMGKIEDVTDKTPNGGGRANISVLLTMVGATSLESVYYFPKTDVAATAIASRAVDCGSARGFGALETMTATELMMDEIADKLGLDPIDTVKFIPRTVRRPRRKIGFRIYKLEISKSFRWKNFERSHRFAGIQPNSGFGYYSHLSCGVGDTQLGRRPGSAGTILILQQLSPSKLPFGFRC